MTTKKQREWLDLPCESKYDTDDYDCLCGACTVMRIVNSEPATLAALRKALLC